MNMKIAAFLSAIFLATSVQGQDFPSRPVRLIVGFSAGGGSDFVARGIANAMSQKLNQTVIVENKAGAGGMIATRAVAKEAPDGYTLLLGSAAAFVINPLLIEDIGYDPIKSFAPVGSVARFNYALLASPKLPYKSLAEVIQYASNNPGKLNIGSAGVGSNTHLVAVAFTKQASIKLTHVPYKGTTGALTDLMAGNIDLLFDSMPTVTNHIKSGEVKAFATTGNVRETETPNLPTLKEFGQNGFEASNWFAIFAPAGTNPEIVNILNKAINESLKDPALLESFKASGNLPLPGSPQDLANLIARESATYRTLIQESDIKID